jgi:hypothetical protein
LEEIVTNLALGKLIVLAIPLVELIKVMSAAEALTKKFGKAATAFVAMASITETIKVLVLISLKSPTGVFPPTNRADPSEVKKTESTEAVKGIDGLAAVKAFVAVFKLKKVMS